MTGPSARAEAAYEALSLALDRVPVGQTELFLSKLALLLALEVGDDRAVEEAIATAGRDLD